MRVRLIFSGILINEEGEMFTVNNYGDIESMDTGALYEISKRDELGNVIEIEDMK